MCPVEFLRFLRVAYNKTGKETEARDISIEHSISIIQEITGCDRKYLSKEEFMAYLSQE